MGDVPIAKKRAFDIDADPDPDPDPDQGICREFSLLCDRGNCKNFAPNSINIDSVLRWLRTALADVCCSECF